MLVISMKSNIIGAGGANMITTTSILKERYKAYVNPQDKIRREVLSGVLYRINRTVYETDSNTEPYLLAASILSPSYLSFDFALSFYGLIPERVVSITSASLNVRKNKTYVNHFGRFEYSDIPAEAFSEGLTYVGPEDRMVKIATREKAICDSLYKWKVVKSVRQLKELMFLDKRIEEEEFKSCDFQRMVRLARLYHRTNLDLLINLIEKEYYSEQRN